MRIVLDHNKILKEAMTAGFCRGMEEGLIPSLCEKFGSALEGVMMYEDYLSDNFVFGGYCYYPLTLVVAGSVQTLWIKWDISDSSMFAGSNPYSYSGEMLNIEIATDTPIAFENAMEDRCVYAAEGSVKITVSAAFKDPAVLSGKYSQAFVDEMARQLTPVIEKAAAVSGLAESSIELTLFFAPDTYMEHTSESVTYRRLLISAKGSAARDLWIKWTRLDSNGAFSVKDSVSKDSIRFELGEGVSQKIREKEYRFLVYSNPEKYRMAMGRKNVVEWRELIKRAVKKGELMKINGSLDDDKHVSEVSDKLAEILQRAGVAAPTVKFADDFKDDTSAVENALRMAIAGSAAPSSVSAAAPTVSSAPSDGDSFDMGDSFDASSAAGSDDGASDAEPSDAPYSGDGVKDGEDEFPVLGGEADVKDGEDEFPVPGGEDFVFGEPSDDTLDKPDVIEIIKPKAEPMPEISAEPEDNGDSSDKSGFELMVDIQTLEARLKLEKEETEKAILDKELCERKLEVALEANKDLTDRADKLEAELIAKKNIIDAVMEENDSLKRERESYILEIGECRAAAEELKSRISELEALLDEARAEVKAKDEQLREQIMLDQKEKEREKLLYAEAARLARIEADKLERERAEAELRERERIEAEARKEREEAERIKAEDEHRKELVRIQSEIEAARERRASDLERAKEIRLRMEAEAKERMGAKYGSGDSEPLEAVYIPKPEVKPDTPVADEPKASDVDFSVEDDNLKPAPEEPKVEAEPQKTPVYVSKQIKLLFVDKQDVRITEKLRSLIGDVIRREGKSSVYIKMKASLQDSTTVVLDVLEIPEDETGLLVEIIKYIGSAGLGIYKGTLE